MEVYIFTDHNDVLEIIGIHQDRYLGMRELYINGPVFLSEWMEFATSVISEGTNNNTSVYKTMIENIFFEMLLFFYPRTLI